MKRLLDALSRVWTFIRILTVLKTVRDFCGSGRARETGDAVDGTGFAGVRGHARSHKDCVSPKGSAVRQQLMGPL